jgi:MFS family permease
MGAGREGGVAGRAGGGRKGGRVVRTGPQKRVIGAYLGTTALYILAASIIWGINTLFLLRAGLDIFEVMLVNTTFTVGQIIFEIPTGVVADTIGRKAAMLWGVGTILVATLLYVGADRFGWGMPVFIGASVFLGLGFTFQVGTVDAWLVDALAHVEWVGPREQVFAWGGMVSGVGMLGGTIIGGVLGSIDLALPYLARSALLALCLVGILVLVKDWGFEPRALEPSRIVAEARRVFVDGVRYGWGNPVIRQLLWVSLLQGLFFIFAFYSSQPYFLDLLRLNLVWVAASVTAGSSVASIAGNALVKRVMARPGGRRRAGRVLAGLTAAQGLLALGTAAVGLVVPAAMRGVAVFAAAVAMWLLLGLLMGMSSPIRMTFINEQIPSDRRATVLSVDALFGDVGGSAGQPVLGYLSRVTSIAVGWVFGALALTASAPFYLAADRRVGGTGESAPDAREGL